MEKANVEVGSSSGWSISTISLDQRICRKFEGCYTPLYDFIF